jgi:hypothetical protein
MAADGAFYLVACIKQRKASGGEMAEKLEVPAGYIPQEQAYYFLHDAAKID